MLRFWLPIPFQFVALSGVLVLLASSGDASAVQKESTQQKDTTDDPFGDLFGDSEESSPDSDPINALRRATQSIDKTKQGKTLVPKDAAVKTKASYSTMSAFAANRIYIHPKKGCQPAGPKKKKISILRYERLPVEGPPMVVCLQLKSNVGRKVSVALSITDARRKKVSFARSTLDFTKKEFVEHIIEYPPSVFKNPGQYEYVIDVEGETIARLPLYKVIIDDDL